MSENQFLPLILLFIFGGFAVLSAVLKARARVTAFSDVVLAVLEGISGMALMAAALPTSGSLESASQIGILTAVLVAVSSTVSTWPKSVLEAGLVRSRRGGAPTRPSSTG